MGVVIIVPASATMIKKMSLKELTNAANTVFVGTVTAVRNEVAPDGASARTAVTFRVVRTVAGQPVGKEETLRFRGGSLPNGLIMKVDGMPEFRAGEKVVLFALNDKSLYCPLAGWFQGKLTVQTDGTVGDAKGKAYGGIRDDELVRPGARGERLSLDDLIAYVEKTRKGSR